MKTAIALVALFATGCHAQGFRVASPLNVQTPGAGPAIIQGFTGSSTARGSLVFGSVSNTLGNSGNVGLSVFQSTAHVQVKDATTDQGYDFYVNGNIFAQGNITCSGSCGGGSSGYNTIQAAGTPVTARLIMNFVSGCTPVDDAGNSRTNITCGGGASLPVVDSTALVFKTGDATATVSIDASLVTTGTNRALKAQNASYTIAGLEQTQTFTATNTMRDVYPAPAPGTSASDTYRLGQSDSGTTCAGPAPCRWYEINVNRINGISAGATLTDNYLLTRQVRFVDQGGLGSSWNGQSNAGSGLVASDLSFTDSSGAFTVGFFRVQAGVVVNQAKFDLNVIPFTNNTRTSGDTGHRWSGLFSVNGDFSGTLTLSGITGSTQLLQVNSSGQVSGAGTGSAGANIQLSNIASTALSADLNFPGSNTRSIGNGSAQALNVFSEFHWSCDASTTNCWKMFSSTSGTNGLFFQDGSSVTRFGLSSFGSLTVGTSSGTAYTSILADTNSSPGINLFRSTNTKAASWSAGATSAFSVQDSADAFKFIVLQTGDVLINTTSTLGAKLSVQAGTGRGVWADGTGALPVGLFTNSNAAASAATTLYASASNTGTAGYFNTDNAAGSSIILASTSSSTGSAFRVSDSAPAGACTDGYVWIRTGSPNGRIYICRNSAWVAGF